MCAHAYTTQSCSDLESFQRRQKRQIINAQPAKKKFPSTLSW